MATPHFSNFPSNASEQIIDDVQLEAGCLYALLAYGGEWGAWEWAFYLPKPVVIPIGREGTLFHVTLYTGNDPPEWRFETDPAKDITASPEVVALIRLARVSDLGEYEDIVRNDGLTSLFKDVKIPSTPDSPMDFSSRTWFTEAIGTLHDCAVVHCDDVWLLEREIKRLGFAAMDRYMESRGWTVFRTDKCS